jgi:hypothetical protein
MMYASVWTGSTRDAHTDKSWLNYPSRPGLNILHVEDLAWLEKGIGV